LLGGGRDARAHLARPPRDGVVFPSTSPFLFCFIFLYRSHDDVDIKEKAKGGRRRRS